MPSFIISLDFELFWGVNESRTVEGYGNNIEGVWNAIPQMLALFNKYEIHATWATVGMLMCRDYAQWKQTEPTILPSYLNQKCSNYVLGDIVKQYPTLFFARPLVEQIQNTLYQEIATHTYSHFYCDEQGATPEQFKQDLICTQQLATEMGIALRSIVLPRNQIKTEFLQQLPCLGIETYRGNPNHWLYQNGHTAPYGKIGRAIRFSDSWLPLTGNHISQNINPNPNIKLVNIPASQFLRPWSNKLKAFEGLRLNRLKNAMTEAAHSSGVYHLWWHPHNFGINTNQNLAVLESLLQHYQFLKNQYGMKSLSMIEFKGINVAS